MIDDARDAYAEREAEIDAADRRQGAMRELERQVMLPVLDRKWREHLYEMDYLKEGIGLRAMAQRDPLIEYQREGFDMFAAMLEGIKEESVGLPVQRAGPGGGAARGARAGGRRRGGEPGGADIADAGRRPGSSPGRSSGCPAAAPVTPEAERTTRVPARSGNSARGGRHAAPESDATAATSALPTVLGGGPRKVSELQYSGPAEDGGTSRSRSGSAAAAAEAAGEPARNRPCPCGSGRKYKHCHGMPTAARP